MPEATGTGRVGEEPSGADLGVQGGQPVDGSFSTTTNVVGGIRNSSWDGVLFIIFYVYNL